MTRSERPHERYTHGHHETVLRSHTWRTVENSAKYLASRLTPGTSVLDIGCGPGTITIDIATIVAPGRVVGIDASREIVPAAAAGALELGVRNVEFAVGDAYALEADDGSFDVVHAHQTLQHLADPVRALREMFRVAAPGGVVAARDGDYGGMFWSPHIDGLDRWMSAYQAVHRSNGGDPNAGRALRGWALDAGFDNVTSSASMWSFGDPDERSWWGGMWADRIIESDFGPQAIALGLADRDDLRQMADAWRRWAGTPNAWFGVPHGEIIIHKDPVAVG